MIAHRNGCSISGYAATKRCGCSGMCWMPQVSGAAHAAVKRHLPLRDRSGGRRSLPQDMAGLKAANLGLKFLLELVAIAAFVYWGASHSPVIVAVILAIAVPAAFVAV